MATVQAKDQPILDGANEQGFLSFYRGLPEKPNTTVRVFDRGEYFTVHGQDAVLAARDLFRTNAVVKMLGSGNKKVESVVLSRLNFESFMRDILLVKHYRVEVYKCKSGTKNDWELEFKASPGNLSQLEEVLFGANLDCTVTTGVMAVKVAPHGSHKLVGVGYIDVAGQEIRMTQFDDTEAFSNLEALVVQLSPRECLLPAGDQGAVGARLKQVMSRNPLLVTERKRTDFNNKDIEQDLGRLLRKRGGGGSHAQLEVAGIHSTSALAAVIKYLELLGDESNFGQYTVKPYDLSHFMRLDAAAVRALHVEPVEGAREEGGSGVTAKTHTVLGLLDKCRTSLGHRMMLQWVRQPLVDVNKIEERLDLVEAFVSSLQLCHNLSEVHLKQIPDLSRLCRRLTRKEANLQDCYRFFRCVERLPNVCEALGGYDGPHTTSLSAAFTTPLQEIIGDLAKFQEMIETTMDLERANAGEYVIQADFDSSLTELRDTMNSLEEKIQGQMRRVASDLCLDAGKTLKLETNTQLGYHFRVTLKDEKVLRNNRSYTVIDTNKTGVRFRNGALRDLNEQHLAAKEEYALQQKALVEEIVGIAAGYVEVIQNLGQVLATLDCTLALAATATTGPKQYVRPRLLTKGSGTLRLEGMRHPCLEMEDDVSVIANDCFLGDGESGRFHIITGPNMGGKSTFLRGVGLAVLMAQMGSFVACKSAEISIVDSILARVGAGDNQQRGVSTFMAEMLETSTILRAATENSLILIDELGRGTSTYDGFGLAWALSEYIAKEIRSFTLFATHFHEVTSLAKEVDTIKNFHVTANCTHEKLTLLYEVRPGPCDRSFGIHVAELASFPQSALEFAKKKAREMEDDFGDDDDSDEAVKKRKRQREEGEEVVESFLNKISKLDCDALNDEELEKEVEKLREEARAHDNPYITHLLARET